MLRFRPRALKQWVGVRMSNGSRGAGAVAISDASRGAERSGPVEKWDTAKLVELVPGSSRKLWLNSWVPALVKLGVLRKLGKAWVARRVAIETALESGFAPVVAR